MRESSGIVRSPDLRMSDTWSILLVDANASYVRSIQKILGASGDINCIVDDVPDIATATPLLRQGNTHDVILLSLDLPDCHGLSTVEAVHYLSPDVPIVILADEAQEAIAWQATEMGASGVLMRSQDNPEIIKTIVRNAIRQQLLCGSLERHIRELEQTNGRFLSLVADNADAIMVIDRVGIIRFVNPSAEQLLRCSASDLLGQMFGVPLEGVDITEVDLPERSGRARTAELHVMRTLWDGERAFIVSMRDISERKRVELDLRIAKQAAEQANEMKSQFLANMSHELRTPLNAIIGYSEMMQMGIAGPLEPPSYRKYVEDINAGGLHLLSLINDLLDLSKAESGQQDLAEEKFDLIVLAQSVIDLIDGQATSAGLETTLSAQFRTLWIHADRRMIKQVLLNLLSNAIKFTPKGGKVTLEVDRDFRDVTVLRVIDTGVGIPKEQLPRAFAAFVQLHDAYVRTENKGTGLGLALTKRFVELHQGKISVDSTVDVGTTVTIELPSDRAIRSGGEATGEILSIVNRLPQQ